MTKNHRDIVQFVQMNAFRNLNKAAYGEEVAKALLAELPAQFLSYYKTAGIIPTKA